MPVVVDEEKCNECKRCVAACPYEAIAIQEKNGTYIKAVWDGKYERAFVPAIIDNASNPTIISIVMGIGAIAFLYSVRSIEKKVKRG